MSTERPSNVAASVRQRLLNLARERGDEFQFILTRYAIERVLYRLPHAAVLHLRVEAQRGAAFGDEAETRGGRACRLEVRGMRARALLRSSWHTARTLGAAGLVRDIEGVAHRSRLELEPQLRAWAGEVGAEVEPDAGSVQFTSCR